MLAARGRRAPRRTRAVRRRPSGCSGSRPRTARARPSASNASRSGSQPVSSRERHGHDLARRRTARRARRPGTPARGSRPARRSPTATCANEKIASFEPSVGTISVSGSTVDAEAARDPRGDRLAELRQPGGARVRRDRRAIPATSASRMNAGVTSRGSPMPKSISSIPRARASAFHSSSRVNGYCARSARTGESAR